MEDQEKQEQAAPIVQIGPVDVELSPGKVFTFEAMRVDDPENMALWLKAMAADDMTTLYPEFVGAVRKNLAERYSGKVDEVMAHVRISPLMGSPWTKIVRILLGL